MPCRGEQDVGSRKDFCYKGWSCMLFMAHDQQLEFVRILSSKLPHLFRDVKVLEIGSLDITGSVRQFYRDCNYTGIDVAPGKGVDVVCQGQDYGASDGSFDQVISCEAMEHNPSWRETFANMIRLTKEGGLVVMTCATYGRPEHGTTSTEPEASPLTVEKGWDYYKNLGQSDFEGTFNLQESFSSYRFWCNWSPKDLYFIGIRTTSDHEVVEKFEAASSMLDQWVAKQNHGAAYRLMNMAASIAGDAGVSLVGQRRINRFIWDMESAMYRSAGFLLSLVKSSNRG
jgi:SAM-dependent methyltransferase